MQYAAKGMSRFMSKPEEQDWRAAKRLARKLKDHWRVVLEYKYQELPKKVVVWSDTDFAGCRRRRRSASGGVVMFGKLCIKTCSQTQEAIALSSGESEFYWTAKAATIGLGMKGLMADLGLEMKHWSTRTRVQLGASHQEEEQEE